MAAPEQSKQIMISYQWDSQKDVLRIKETLDKLGYKVWMDIDQMRGNIYQKMSEGVENSDVIVVCMSAKYQTSECCNRELQYAQDMRKKIIPIKIEKGYVPHGALGLIVSGALYVDFSDPLKFDEKFSALLGEINNSLGVQDNRKIESTAHEHRQKSNSGNMVGDDQVLYAVKDGSLFSASPPADASKPWGSVSNYKCIGKDWADMHLIFLDNVGMLFAVTKQGQMLKATVPMNFEDDWKSRAICIGKSGWQKFQFVFFDNHGMMYAIRHKGQFLKATPPVSSADCWKMRADCIGTAGWNSFKFLFFDNNGMLFAVTGDGSLVKGAPPSGPNDEWLARSECVGKRGWDGFKFLSFDTSGLLYAVSDEGTFYKGAPPTDPYASWVNSASCIGNSGWNKFDFLFFGRA